MKKLEKYKQYFTKEYMMGPNCVRIAAELLSKYPLNLNGHNTVLEIGCGTGLSSLYFATETNAILHAYDLWISEEDNMKRFRQWNMDKRIVSFCKDVSKVQFEKEKYDAVVSIDAYHYFAGKEGFFIERILPAIKSGGITLICVPGIKEEYEGKQKETIQEWVKEEAYMFHSCSWWRNIIGDHPDIGFVNIWELECFDESWKEWFDTKHPVVDGDIKYYESTIKKYTNLIGIVVKKK